MSIFVRFNTMAMTLDEQINQALEVLRRGGIILYPTDTVWGIGCDATNPEAVGKIYALKKSENKKSMLVLLDQIEKVSLYIQKVPDVAWQLYEVADKPLTLILPEARGVAANLIPEEGTLGIRIADHEFCKRLIQANCSKPLVSTSAKYSPANPLRPLSAKFRKRSSTASIWSLIRSSTSIRRIKRRRS